MEYALPRPYIAVGAAAAVVGLLIASVEAPSIPNAEVRAIRLANDSDEIAFIMGGSGHPIPPDDYIAGVNEEYIQPLYPGYDPEPLFYPAGASGSFSGVKSLTFDESVEQGLTILNHKIMSETADGTDVTVFGHSQSSTIISLEMARLAAGDTGGLGPPPDPDQLHFVMTGDPGVPNGGLLTRFPDLSMPSLGTTYEGVTPDTPYTTDVYTIEYDGFADFPKYPLNLLADINALMGTAQLHPYENYIDPANVDDAITLPASDEANTTYHIIPTDELPILTPVRDIPVVGEPLADLLEPDLEILVNLGYGSDPTQGWSSPMDEHTSFGLFPDVELSEIVQDLVKGARQGFEAAVDDLRSLEFPDPSEGLESNWFVDLSASDSSDSLDIDDFVNPLTRIISSVPQVLLQTVDVANAMFTTLPAYDAHLFIQGIEEGNFIEAIGLPIAADIGLGAMLINGEIADLQGEAHTVNEELDAIGAALMTS